MRLATLAVVLCLSLPAHASLVGTIKRVIHERRLKQIKVANRKIDALLIAAKHNRHKTSGVEVDLRPGERVGVTFRHAASGPMLILYSGLSQHGMYLHDDGKGGFTLKLDDRVGLAKALAKQ